jgi:hypothetical protein
MNCSFKIETFAPGIGQENFTKENTLKMISLIPSGIRSVEYAVSACNAFKNISNSQTALAILNLIEYSPPEYREMLFDQVIEIPPPSAPKKAIRIDGILLKEFFTHWEKELIYCKNPRKSRSLALFIQRNFDEKIPGHLRHLVSGVISITEKESLALPQNPYHIYRKILKNRELILDYSPSPDYVVIATPPRELRGDHPPSTTELVSLSYNMRYFRDSAEMHGTTFQDLRAFFPEFSHDLIRLLFQRIDIILADTNEDKRRETLRAIEDCTGSSYEFLRAHIVEDSYLCRLSSLFQQENLVAKQAPSDLIRFCCIIKSIHSLSSDVIEGSPLTEQEGSLLKIAAILSVCFGGKYEGCSKAYNLLDSEFKISKLHTSDLTPNSAYAINFIFEEMQTLLVNTFASEEFIQKAAETEGPPYELSHHSLYGKNNIGEHVGLLHEVQFDIYTREVSDELLAKSPEDLLKAFYEVFPSPSNLVKNMTHRINERLSCYIPTCRDSEGTLFWKDPLYKGISELMDESRVPSSELWDYNDDDNIFHGLKEHGFAALLNKTGYFNRHTRMQ